MSIALFDEIRIYYGSDKLATIFRDMVDNDVEEALKSLNQKNLLFPSLFVLHNEINNVGLNERLSNRNKYAMDLINQVLADEELDSERLQSGNIQENLTAARWILESGSSEDGLSDEFDQVLDTSAIVLCKLYNDRSCLRTVETLIFDRHRKGSYTYDLTWVFFETLNPQNLNTLANRLRSANPKDVELARKFLNFIPDLDNRNNDARKQHQIASRWINRNQNFLYFTGSSNQQTIDPMRYEVSLEAKYLQRPVGSIMTEQSRALRKEEVTYLDNFNKLDDDVKLLLSNCSDYLCRSDRYKWSKWLHSPLEKQIEMAERMVGNQND
ncbi:hypothetical protein [Ruminiclostridium cellobioparum]|uniref:Uncharacterized protein n=1 Tax=Ruminiclostridium cellobioparum subsp. termitidis CT1112 TaxID=1195236 RepID=S0FTH4_RUMCE|nr:hypothetical protein [Ruminiclostridium cellobioparum]EMS71803.1 hypothetical protein CTER_2267 [Ruminiclostridium cellobioparum subsp. termitidis CT1112]